jgi:predicted 3-demethylubiquinone-9 3-methyltransferase (glyoxalase superfamily)
MSATRIDTKAADTEQLNEFGVRGKITPYLWFEDRAEEAAKFYTTLFPGSKINSTTRNPGAIGEEGSVLIVAFELAGQEFIALNGGPQFKLNESFSIFVTCETQEEVDNLWNRLTANGGEESQCGWLKDRYGLSWQIIPRALGEMMSDPDREKARRATEAMLQMRKLDIATLRRAYEGR